MRQFKCICMEENFTPFHNSVFITQEFVNFLVEQCPLGNSRIHGITHWTNVLMNGRKLTQETGANLKVVELFSVLHDARRENDDYDPAHGRRAAELAKSCNGHWFHLEENEMLDLYEACFYHADGLTEHNITVMTCWDADRLDLGRVYIKPNPKYLCTHQAICFSINN